MAVIKCPADDDKAVKEFVNWDNIKAKSATTFTVSGSSAEDLLTYQIQNSVDDGFVRLYTMAGHRYWIAQAENGHRTSDWKLHFSIRRDDLAAAWNAVSELFIHCRCSAAMKMVNGHTEPPVFMAGRELTVYIYRHSSKYNRCHFFENDKAQCLSRSLDQSSDFWRSFVAAAERALQLAGLQPGPLADGDRMLGRYCSLRNEAFVRVPPRIKAQFTDDERSFFESFKSGTRDGSTYPPNALGYNAFGHQDPVASCVYDTLRRNATSWGMVAAFLVLLFAVLAGKCRQMELQIP